jgi:hypothetical protein
MALEVSSDGWKMMSVMSIATDDHSSGGRCWHNHCPSLLGIQTSRLSIEQWCAPHQKGPRWLHINCNADTCNRKDSIRRLQWPLHWTSASMPMRKWRIPRRRWRGDRRSVMTTTMMATPPLRRRRYLPRRNPPGDSAPMTVTPPTQRTMTTTTMMTTTTTMMGVKMRTTTSSPMTSSIC